MTDILCSLVDAHGEARDHRGRLWRWELGPCGIGFVDRNGNGLKGYPGPRNPVWQIIEAQIHQQEAHR